MIVRKRQVAPLFVALWCPVSIARLQAGVIYTSFTSDQTYTCCIGQGVTGPTATNAGVVVGQQQTAGAFTPIGNFTLTQIDVAFYAADNFPPDNDTNGFILSLNQDSGGAPGEAIETWTGLTAPTQGAGISFLVQTVFPVSTVLLLSESQYWLVASPAASNSYDNWNLNVPSGGPGGRLAKNFGSGWSVFDDPNHTLGFDVQGTATPEPSALSLLVVGLLGIGYGVSRSIRRRSL